MAVFRELKALALQTLKDNAVAIGVHVSDIGIKIIGDDVTAPKKGTSLHIYMADRGDMTGTPLRVVTIGLLAASSAADPSKAQDECHRVLELAAHHLQPVFRDISLSSIDDLRKDSDCFVSACELTTTAQPEWALQ